MTKAVVTLCKVADFVETWSPAGSVCDGRQDDLQDRNCLDDAAADEETSGVRSHWK